MIFIYFLSLISSLIFCESDKIESKKMEPKLENITLDMNLEHLFEFKPIERNYLTAMQIQDIKDRAKNFSVESANLDDIVVLETNYGTMKLKLFTDISPKHCNNFKKLCNSGFYDKTSFHQVFSNSY